MSLARRNCWSGSRTSSPSTRKSKCRALWSCSAAHRERAKGLRISYSCMDGWDSAGGCLPMARRLLTISERPCGRGRRGRRWRWAAPAVGAAAWWWSARAPGARGRRPWLRQRMGGRRWGGCCRCCGGGKDWGMVLGVWAVDLTWLGFQRCWPHFIETTGRARGIVDWGYKFLDKHLFLIFIYFLTSTYVLVYVLFNQSFWFIFYFLNIAHVQFLVPNSKSFVFHPWIVSNIFLVSFKGCFDQFMPCHPSPVP